jgi:O-antigen ligase
MNGRVIATSTQKNKILDSYNFKNTIAKQVLHAEPAPADPIEAITILGTMLKTLLSYDLPTGQTLTDRQARLWPIVCRLTDVMLVLFICFATVSISLMQAAYILAIFFWLLQLYLNPHRLHLPLLTPVCGFALASLLATLAAVDPRSSLFECRNLFEWLVFYMALNTLRSEARATLLIQLLIAAGTVMALYGFSQVIAHGSTFRIAGTSSYMTFGGQLLLIGILALSQLLFHPPSRHWYWLVPAFAILLLALVGTQTRNAWLGFIIACPLLLSLRHRAFLFVVPLLCAILFALAPHTVQNRIRSFGNLQDLSVQERFFMWRSGAAMTRDHPWTGVGMGVMREMEKRYRAPEAPFEPERRLSHLHNNIVQIAAERGLFGLGWWAIIWVVFLWQGWRAYRQSGSPGGRDQALVAGSLACVFGFLVAGLFEYNFGDSEVVTIVYFVMALPFLVRTSEPLPST